MDIESNIIAFETVAQSLASSPKHHSYLNITNPSAPRCRVLKTKYNASSFNKITACAAKVFASKGDIEDKMRLAKSFEAILELFAKKKKKIHYLLFFFWFLKRKQINTAKILLGDFYKTYDTIKQKEIKEKNTNTIVALKKKGIFVKNHQVVSQLNSGPVGAYVIWHEPGYFCFLQKNSNHSRLTCDLQDLESECIKIPSDQDLEEELNILISQQESLKRLQKENKFFYDIESASKALGATTSYAFISQSTPEGKKLYFMQKIPGISLENCPGLLVSPEVDIFALIEEETSKARRFVLLKEYGITVFEEDSDFYKEEKKLKELGRFYINSSMNHIMTVHLGSEIKRLKADGDFFLELDIFLDNTWKIEELKKKGLLKKKEEVFQTLLTKKLPGSYVVWENEGEGYEFLQLADSQTLFQKDLESIKIPKDQNLAKIIDYQLSREGRLEILKKKGKLFEDYQSVVDKLGSSISYALFFQEIQKEKVLYFIQKVPGISLEHCQPILVENDLLLFIKEQINLSSRVLLLQKNNKVIFDLEKNGGAHAFLKDAGDWLVDCSEQGNITIHYLDEEMKPQKLLHTATKDLFLECESIIQKKNKPGKNIPAEAMHEPQKVIEYNFQLDAARLKEEGKFFDDYASAAEQLGRSTSYAFFYDEQQQLFFVQKIPGIPLEKCRPLAVPALANLQTFMEAQINLQQRLELLKDAESSNYKNHPIYMKLENGGDWLIEPASNDCVKISWLDEFRSFRQKELACSDDWFLEFDGELNMLLSNSTHIFRSMEELHKYLQKQPAGQYGLIKESGKSVIVKMRMPGQTRSIIYTFSDVDTTDKLSKNLQRLVSIKNLANVLQKKGYLVTSRQEAEAKLINQEYVVLLELQICKLLMKGSSEEVLLDASKNLFEQIEQHLAFSLSKYPQFAADKKTALAKLKENPQIGSFIFKKSRSVDLYRTFIYVDGPKFETTLLSREQIISLVECKDADKQLWQALEYVGYVVPNQEAAHEKYLKSKNRYAIWKESVLIMFIPICKGLVPARIRYLICSTALNNFQQELAKVANPPQEQLYEWLKNSGVIVEDEESARSVLLPMPLGSYVVWKNDATLYFLQKQHNQSSISNKPIPLSQKYPLEDIRKQVGQEAQLNWLNTHRHLVDQQATLSKGCYQIVFHKDRVEVLFAHPFVDSVTTLTLDPAEEIWRQFDKLTSRNAHVSLLKEQGDIWFDSESDAKTKCTYSQKFCCWQLVDGTIAASIKIAGTNKIFRIGLHENLIKKIYEHFE